jgi:hypothetical protein
MLRFSLLTSKSGVKDRKFALGGLRVDQAHLSGPRKMEGIKNSDPPVFVVPKFDHTVMSDWVKRQLEVGFERKKVPISIGGRRVKHEVEVATLTYRIVDDSGQLSGPLVGEVCFSSELVDRLVQHFSNQLALSDPARDQLDEASGIISWEHLVNNGHEHPQIDITGPSVVIRKRPGTNS